MAMKDLIKYAMKDPEALLQTFFQAPWSWIISGSEVSTRTKLFTTVLKRN